MLSLMPSAKRGHVGTNYTLSRNMPYLSAGIKYLYYVIRIIKSIKCVI